MFNSSEPEGEVDHSFFDSDCDDYRVDGRVKKGGLKAEKQSFKPYKLLPAKHIKDEGIDLSPRTERMRRHLKQAENQTRVSEALFVSCKSDKAISNSSDSEDDSNRRSKRPSGTFLALVADALETDCNNTENTNKTGENALAASSNRRSEKSSGKLLQGHHPQSPSPALTDASADADSESSCRSQKSVLGSPSLPKTTKSSVRHGVRRTRVGSAGSQDSPALSTDESDGTVTDVSPLSSPDSSPPQSLNLNHAEVEKESDEEQQKSVASSGLSNMHQEEGSFQEKEESTFSLESQLEHKLVLRCPGGRNRKNYSFSNDEVLRIDRENQRLLRELSRLSSSRTSRKATLKKPFVANNSPLIQVSHSALNRQREQRRIERENLAFLKRLESVKSTPSLRCSEQLADHQRLTGYPGASSHPLRSGVKKEKCSRRTSSALTGPRPVSSRATFTNTDSSSTPVPRSKNQPNPPGSPITTSNSQ